MTFQKNLLPPSSGQKTYPHSSKLTCHHIQDGHTFHVHCYQNLKFNNFSKSWLLSSEMWCHVVWSIGTHILEESATSTFRVEDLPWFLLNTATYLPNQNTTIFIFSLMRTSCLTNTHKLITLQWDVTPCCLVEKYQRFR